MIEIKINGHKYYCPQNWKDVKIHQMIHLFRHLMNPPDDRYQMQLFALMAFTGISSVYLFRMDPVVLRDLVSIVAFVNEDMLHAPVAKFKWKGHTYYPAASGFRNVTGFEYADLENQLQMIISGNNAERALLRILANLYRRTDSKSDPKSADYAGDVREPFNSWVIDSRADEIIGISNEYVLSALIFYLLNRNRIYDTYDKVFDHEDDTDLNGPVVDRPIQIGITGMILELAETGMFGDFEKTGKTYIHTLLLAQQKRISDRIPVKQK